jgi:hypothetical protein
MEIKIFRIDEDKRKDKEKFPTSIIFGRLLMSETEKDNEDVEINNDNNATDEEAPF